MYADIALDHKILKDIIGEKIFLGSRTAEGYRMKILEKLKVKNTVGIVIEAIHLGIYIPE